MTISHASTLGLLTTLAALTACATASNGSSPAVEGCFYFQRDAAAQALGLPWGIRFLPDSLEGWPALNAYEGVRRAATLTPHGDADHPFGYWRTLPGDSIHVGYPAGGGVSLRLQVGEDTLRGNARPVGDAAGLDGTVDRQERSVTLTRARCPEEG